MKVGQDMQSANRKLLLRLRLYVSSLPYTRVRVVHLSLVDISQQADLVVKAPKPAQPAGQGNAGATGAGPSGAHDGNNLAGPAAPSTGGLASTMLGALKSGLGISGHGDGY